MMDFVVPGKIVGQFQDGYVIGEGVYLVGNDIIACVSGTLQVTKELKDNVERVLIDVINQKSKNLVPAVGKLVTCQVVRITHKFCQCKILIVETNILKGSFTGFIRKEDVKTLDRDKDEMNSCFKAGDHIIARVISLDCNIGFMLSTAEKELGVVDAVSEAGVRMEPISHKEMRCPKTGIVERRKVACPQARYLKRCN